jgi:hypothetical protein
MKLKIVMEFDDVEAGSARAIEILAQVNESCDAMRVAFDAQECYVQLIADKEVNK